MAEDRWASDPWRRHEQRYYDGFRWTHYVSDAGVTSEDFDALSMPEPPPAPQPPLAPAPPTTAEALTVAPTLATPKAAASIANPPIRTMPETRAAPTTGQDQLRALWARPWVKCTAIGLTAALLVGVGAAAGSSSANSARDKYKTELDTEAATTKAAASRAADAAKAASSNVAALHSQLEAASLQAKAATDRANGAEAAAVKTAKTKLASQSAALDARKKQLDGQASAVAEREAAVAAAEGHLKANTITGEGVFGVGADMQPGTWHTNGASGCYYAILNSTDTSDIADNNNTDGPATVTLQSGKYFEVSGCADWTKIG
jgi:hypothetical protein